MEACDRLPWEEYVLLTDRLLNMNLWEIKTVLILDDKKKDCIDSVWNLIADYHYCNDSLLEFCFYKKKKKNLQKNN